MKIFVLMITRNEYHSCHCWNASLQYTETMPTGSLFFCGVMLLLWMECSSADRFFEPSVNTVSLIPSIKPSSRSRMDTSCTSSGIPSILTGVLYRQRRSYKASLRRRVVNLSLFHPSLLQVYYYHPWIFNYGPDQWRHEPLLHTWGRPRREYGRRLVRKPFVGRYTDTHTASQSVRPRHDASCLVFPDVRRWSNKFQDYSEPISRPVTNWGITFISDM